MDLDFEIQKTNVRMRINNLEIPYVPIFRQNRQLYDIGFWGLNFKNLSPDLELAPPRNRLCQFSVKMDSFEISGPNFGKLLNYVRYFSSSKVEDIAESWVKVDGAGCTIK